MQKLTLTGHCATAPVPRSRIYCPALDGLTPRQADLSFVMPRMDHNRALRETANQGDWASILASDPFGSTSAFFSRLKELGYRGVANWPSSILLEGILKETMATIPATPEFEYDVLASAQRAGLGAMAFFLSLQQARAAMQAGIKRLVLHPGLLVSEGGIAPDMVLGSLQRLINALKSEAETVEVLVYTSAWHERSLPLSTLTADGVIWFGDAP
ncbi:phosphoenolpyruvate hydrolase family protein [Shimia sp. R9_2]|uniref:phosphoenolpyruvate hydrolase family protein n=1 Tax=Shimia sp. R9_2 TaxID=2821112 RepID=UPI001ADCD09A|nr:phosphoenolpyruvate hydrolase family protein [Shimia sp. R9_2]MBO9398790.1 phosphoenolpyruvate hydrolase family protein [Shimia sp. R9_2]